MIKAKSISTFIHINNNRDKKVYSFNLKKQVLRFLNIKLGQICSCSWTSLRTTILLSLLTSLLLILHYIFPSINTLQYKNTESREKKENPLMFQFFFSCNSFFSSFLPFCLLLSSYSNVQRLTSLWTQSFYLATKKREKKRTEREKRIKDESFFWRQVNGSFSRGRWKRGIRIKENKESKFTG